MRSPGMGQLSTPRNILAWISFYLAHMKKFSGSHTVSDRLGLCSVCLMATVFLCATPLLTADLGWGQWHLAWADDNDDGDDQERGGRSFGSGDDPASVRKSRSRTTRRQAVASAPPPAAFAAEIVVTDLSAQDLATLIAEGFSLAERKTIVTLAATLDRLSPPAGVSLEAARDRVRLLATGRDADFNHFYRSSQADTGEVGPAQPVAAACTHDNCDAWRAINWPVGRIASGRCQVTTVIGLIDTGINTDHDIIAGARLNVIQRAGTNLPSGAVHGTAIASLLVGSETSRVPGLLPDAEVLAVDVFDRVSGDERADVPALVEGLDLLATRKVRLYNLSLSGPPNTVLSRMLDRLTDEAGLDATVVSAAGNSGPTAPPAWPGAHPYVLAVTAIDTRERLYRQAQRGDHLALAAPGVNILAATSVQGARGKTGTSFAVPFVTATAALLMSQPTPQTGAQVRATLAATARDLGGPGRDSMFGFGLVSAGLFCP